MVNDNGGTLVAADFPLTANGAAYVSGVSQSVSAGTYALAETNQAGYTAGAWSCDAGTLTGSSLVLANGQSATCTIVNDDQAATLTLVKSVVNDNGGTLVAADFPLTANGAAYVSGVSQSVSAGTYALAETNQAGYTAGAWSCDAGTLTGSSLVLANGQSATCTIVNDDQAATLTLVKSVDNTGGGTAVATDWTLIASGPTPLSGAGGVAATPVNAGTYTLTESAGPADYLAGTWSCTAGTLTGNNLVITNGISSVCSLTNTFQSAPAQTLIKAVTNDSTGGTAAVGDVLEYTITLTNTGNTTLTGVVVNDSKISPNSITCASVAPGGTCVLVGTYTVLQSDADAGTIQNVATVTSPLCPAGGVGVCTVTVDTPVFQTSTSVAKSVNMAGPVNPGDTLTYTLTVAVNDSATLERSP